MATYDVEAFKRALSESEARLGAPAGSRVRQAMTESSFDPKIISGEVKSPAGATGLMQFMPETAQEYGIDPTDPMASIAASEEMLRRLNGKYGGDWEKTFAAYNWGEGNVDREGMDSMPGETRGYLEKVLSTSGAPQASAAPPSWSEIAASREYQQFDDEGKREARNAYFDAAIAPQLNPDQFDEARVIFEEQTRPSESDFFGGLSDLGSTLADAPTHIGAAAARAIEGDEPILGGTDDWTDRIIAESERLTAEDLRKPGGRDTFLPGIPREAVRTLGQNLGFSVTSMGAGVATGLAAGAVTGPVGGFTAGGTASGAVANRAAKNSFTRQIYASVNEDWQKSHNGEDIPLKKWAKKKAEVQDIINEHGLFEAVPEAIGNVAGLGLIVKSLTKVLGKSVAKNFIAKATGVLGTEMATETVTQIGQRGTEVDVGLAEEEERLSFSKGEDWLTAAKEVAPSVILLTAFTGGAAAVGAKAHRTFLSDPKASQTVQDAAASDDLSVVPDEILAEAIKRGETLQERRPDDEPLAEAIKVFKAEQTRRTEHGFKPSESSPQEERELAEMTQEGEQKRAEANAAPEESEKAVEARAAGFARQEAALEAEKQIAFEEAERPAAETKKQLEDFQIKQAIESPESENAMQAAFRAAQKKAGATLEVKAHEAATSPKNDLPAPTEAQIDAGNYRKGHVQVEGMDIAIENPAGSTRSGVDPGGQKWSVSMQQHYGYIKRSEGADGDHVDVFVNPKPYAMAADIPQAGKKVFIIDQKNPTTGKFDEHKAMLGFQTRGQAKAAYMANYAKDWAGFGGMTTLDIPAFKAWLKDGDTTKPLVFSKKPKVAPKPKAKAKYAPPAAPQEAVIAKAARDYGDIKAYRRHLRGRLGAVEYAKAEKRIEAAWDELRGPARLFSRDKGAASAGNTVEKLTGTLARPLKKLAPFVKVNIVQKTTDLPFSAPSDTKGGYYRGEAYLVADNTPEKEAATIFQHEVVGHLGLEQMLGAERMAEVVAEVQALKAAHTPDIVDALRHIDDTHGALPPDIEAKEVLAYLAQKGIKNSLLRKVVAWIRQFFARLGFGNYDTAVIESMIADAARFVEKGTPARGGAPGGPPIYAKSARPFYSAVKRAAAAVPQRTATAGQWQAMIAKAPGVKAEEIAWLGLNEWLAMQSGPITKEQVLEFLRANEIQVEEVTKGETVERTFRALTPEESADFNKVLKEVDYLGFDSAAEAKHAIRTHSDWLSRWGGEEHLQLEELGELYRGSVVPHTVTVGATKFESYQTPGGENYRELLLTLPTDESKLPTIPPGETLSSYNEKMIDKYDVFDASLAWPEMTLEEQQITKILQQGGMTKGVSEGYTSGHYDEPNVLAHVRYNERTDANGKRVLFIEEVQSDWHQEGRKGGYRSDQPIPTDEQVREYFDLVEGADPADYRDEMMERTAGARVPDAPFKTSWPMLAMKRMIRHAAENGFDSIAWTTGEQQAERYDLSKHVESVDVERYDLDSVGPVADIRVIDKNGKQIHSVDAAGPSQVEGLIGKDLADKIFLQDPETRKQYTSLDLKVGGEGMKGFYDKILPAAVNKYVKKWGARVGRTEIGADASEYEISGEWVVVGEQGNVLVDFNSEKRAKEYVEKYSRGNDPLFVKNAKAFRPSVHSLDITPAMKESVMQGQPLFARTKKAYNYRSEGISEETHGVLTEIIDTIKATRKKKVDGKLIPAEVDGKPIAREMTEEFNQWDKWVGTLDNLIRRNIASGRVSPADAAILEQYMKDAKGLQMDRDETLAKTNDAVIAYNSLGSANLWGKLSGKPTEQQTRLSKALFEGTQENIDYSEDLATLKEKYGLEDRAVDAYLTIRKYFDQSMREYQVRILQRVGFSPRQAETLVSGGEVTAEDSGHAPEIIALGRQIVKDFTELKGYFPLMRHGDFTVSVKNDRGDLVYFSAQESKSANAAELGRIRRKYDATHAVSYGRLEKQTGDAMVMDPRMLSMLKEYADQAGDAGVKDFADEIEQKMLKTFSERTFRKRFIHRSGVPGYDPDVVRSMASYGWSSSNYLSKMRFIPKLKDARASLGAKTMPQIRTKLGEDIQYLEQPGEEFAGFKSITFAMYMGLNVKSALVNLTQIPLTLYPYLASRYGDTKSTGAIMRAQKQTMRNKPTGDTQLDALLKWAETEGLTMDQYLSELIGAARGKRAAMARGRSKMLESMTFMFSAAEKWNRRVSVAATYHLEKKNFKPEDWVNGVPPDALKALVADAVQKTQFDYGKFNRPKAFRGIGGIPLQFNQFMINYLQFLAGNGGGAGARNRSLAVLFGMVGIMGLPFADDARAFIEYLMTKATGKHTDLELAARRNLINIAKEFMSDADARRAAEFVLRGHGAIVPVDLTGSLTVGSPIPGFTKFFDTASARGVGAGATAAAKQIAGAGPSLIFNAGKGFDEYARAGDPLRAAETIMPVVAIKNAFKAIRVGIAGVDRSATGGINVAYTPTEIDIIAQAMSFQPSQRSMLYRMRNVGHREEAFLRMAHDKMVTPLAIAVAEGDLVRRQRALQVIVAWNREVPNKWKLSMKKVQRSIKARSRTFEITPRTETGVRTRQLRRSAQEAIDLFPER